MKRKVIPSILLFVCLFASSLVSAQSKVTNSTPTKTQTTTMTPEDQILVILKKEGKPMNTGSIAEKSGLDRKVIDKAMKILKAEGKIKTPKVNYWCPA